MILTRLGILLVVQRMTELRLGFLADFLARTVLNTFIGPIKVSTSLVLFQVACLASHVRVA